jgi:uncharacterized lipoprotein YajG
VKRLLIVLISLAILTGCKATDNSQPHEPGPTNGGEAGLPY